LKNHWRLIGKGQCVHWEKLHEDISIEEPLARKPPKESEQSFKKWLDERQTHSILSSASDVNGNLSEALLRGAYGNRLSSKNA
jgi:hypothetical protein